MSHNLWQTSGFGVLSADFKTASQSGNLFSFCFLFCFAASKYSFLSFLYYSWKVFSIVRWNLILKLIPRQVFKWLATLSNSMTPPTLHLSHLNWCSVSKWPSNFNGLAVLNGSFFASSHHGQLSWFHKFFHWTIWDSKIFENLQNLPEAFHCFGFLKMACLSGFINIMAIFLGYLSFHSKLVLWNFSRMLWNFFSLLWNFFRSLWKKFSVLWKFSNLQPNFFSFW